MSSKGSVLVAMSGGVDSSVAGCLLREQGYEVVGSHMRLVHLDGVEHGCCGPAARRDAAEVARIAGFAFEICDLTDAFERTVIADFVAEHEAGRTPNPCARCNGEIKFGAFLRRANELGVDFVATGHYRHGVVLAPITAKLIAGALAGTAAVPEAFDPARFKPATAGATATRSAGIPLPVDGNEAGGGV